MTERSAGDASVAFYARSSSRAGDWWTLLHPPYTVWHLSYVVIGAALAPDLDVGVLLGTVAAFFLAVGVAAHALDELHDRPLRTAIADRTLWTITVGALAIVAVGGLLALPHIGAGIVLPLAAVGFVLVVGYNLELLGGRLHTDRAFALAWGAFPVLAGGILQSGTVRPSYIAAAAAAYFVSAAQRSLSLRARALRRQREVVDGIVERDGQTEAITQAWLLAPIEGALKALCWAVPCVAAALLLEQIA